MKSTSSSSQSTRSTKGTSTSPHARPLLLPDEIRRMRADQVIVLPHGQPPHRLGRLDYLSDPDSATQGEAYLLMSGTVRWPLRLTRR